MIYLRDCPEGTLRRAGTLRQHQATVMQKVEKRPVRAGCRAINQDGPAVSRDLGHHIESFRAFDRHDFDVEIKGTSDGLHA
jgi:hypothetical protein